MFLEGDEADFGIFQCAVAGSRTPSGLFSERTNGSTSSPACTLLMLPRKSSRSSPRLIRAAARVIFLVTNSKPRLGDSWLNRMPEQAKIP